MKVINTVTGLGTAFIKETWVTNLVECLYKLSLSGGRPIVFQNLDDLAHFEKKRLVSNNRITVVPGSGVDLNQFRAGPLPENEECSFLFIGRMLRDKGIKEYVEAARLVRSQYPAARFKLLGPLGAANRTAISGGDLSNWLKNGIVEYLGETEDVRPFIRAAHCIVLPSYREGMSRVLLEAAAMGRPLIGTDVTGCRDIIQNGANGYLCRPRDANDLASKMSKFISLPGNEKQNMGNESRATAEARFDVQNVVSTYLTLIDEEIADQPDLCAEVIG
jgi:glycosyltransferase involved in cell wall biosynthesis